MLDIISYTINKYENIQITQFANIVYLPVPTTTRYEVEITL